LISEHFKVAELPRCVSMLLAEAMRILAPTRQARVRLRLATNSQEAYLGDTENQW
jgi:hypothetical protein